jgi:hypothetical protein
VKDFTFHKEKERLSCFFNDKAPAEGSAGALLCKKSSL